MTASDGMYGTGAKRDQIQKVFLEESLDIVFSRFSVLQMKIFRLRIGGGEGGGSYSKVTEQVCRGQKPGPLLRQYPGSKDCYQ